MGAHATERPAPLPKAWSKTVIAALTQAVSLARVVLLEVRSGFEDGGLALARFAARAEGAEQRAAMLKEELRIKDERMKRIRPARRPQYTPSERLAILSLRAASGWSAEETARRFAVTGATIRSWAKEAGTGQEGLVQTRDPVNRFPEFVRELVRRLRVAAPSLGQRKIAQHLARAGLHLSASTVGRCLKGSPGPKDSPAKAAGDVVVPTAPESAAGQAVPKKRGGTIIARYAHHVWHVDLTQVPAWLGMWVPWVPQSLLQVWPFCWWVAMVVDHRTRLIVGTAAYRCPPTTAQVCTMLENCAVRAGQKPRYVITDQGAQFQAEYRTWCQEQGIRPRFGAVGQHGSIAVVERVIGSLKREHLRGILLPLGERRMVRALEAYERWYNEQRPHETLGGRTPREALLGVLQRPRPMEVRARYPLAPGPGPDQRRRRREQRRLELVVGSHEGHAHLPVVTLRRAA